MQMDWKNKKIWYLVVAVVIILLIALGSFSFGKIAGGKAEPTPTLTPSPTAEPTSSPSITPTVAITKVPTRVPTRTPTGAPTNTAAPVPTATQTPTPTPIIFTVLTVTASVDPASYTGSCPKKFDFASVITTNAAGSVTYKWERSDGASASVQTLIFASAGSQTVNTSWTLSPASYSGWEKVKIESPNSLTSNQANFTLTCI